MIRKITRETTVDQLAEALYEGTAAVSNLAETLARMYGEAEALSFYGLMGDDTQNFWRWIAKQLIDHSRCWLPNEGCCCILAEEEKGRLKNLPRIDPDYKGAKE